jgi:hypothetical protein
VHMMAHMCTAPCHVKLQETQSLGRPTDAPCGVDHSPASFNVHAKGSTPQNAHWHSPCTYCQLLT